MKEQAGSRGKLFLGPGRGWEVRRKENKEADEEGRGELNS